MRYTCTLTASSTAVQRGRRHSSHTVRHTSSTPRHDASKRLVWPQAVAHKQNLLRPPPASMPLQGRQEGGREGG